MNQKGSKTGTGCALSAAMLLVFFLALAMGLYVRSGRELPREPAFQLTAPLELASLPTAARFDFPIGSEHGAFAYNAQPFTENRHLGDDLNGIGGENSDLGDPVFAVADGRVLFAGEGGPGWGNIVIILHALQENGARRYVQSYYAHLQNILVTPRRDVLRGDQIGTIGTANGRYLAHLHFEMREFITPFVGLGYREDTRGWLNPTEFIEQHRGAPDDDVGRPTR
ncbi:MAG: M23 family metallopeptidase [Verrucomicrobiota bacterium]|nr:M23 family metallopeptidase [Verrucomicrobiota bacterium]